MKNFRIQIILRIIFIVLSVLIFSWLYFQNKSTVYLIILILLLLIQSILLFKYIDTTNRELSKFLESIKYSDFSAGFNKDFMGSSFKELNQAFREVMSKFLSARAEKEENFRNLQTVIQHIGTGLISYNQSGDVEFINNAAKRILQLNSLKNISSLKPNHKNLYEKLLKIKAGDKNVVKINIDNDLLQLFIYATEFKMRNQDFKLIALQNIQNELEEQEMMAWQKLIKVLTHEIMNSITPISSLSATLNKMLPELKKDNKHINSELFEDISSAVTTISKRSEGLLHFVDKYRSLTKIPKPNFQVISIYSLFNRIKSLMKNEFINQNINCQFMVIPESLELTADPELIEQVLLNLIYNSMDGLTNNVEKEISISAGLSNIGKIELRVKDNGQGISDEIKEQIFVPFYSTKKNGSGIGLSLARQIMHLHGGDIRVHSIKNVETTFSLIF